MVFLFSQVVPLGSLSEIQPLMDRIHELVSPVEKVGVVLIEKAGADANGARAAAQGRTGRGLSKSRSTVTASDG